MIDSFDRRALLRGFLVAIAITVPVGIVFNIAVGDTDDASGTAVLLSSLAVLIGLATGAAVAAATQDRGLPLAHGTVAAVGALLVVTLVSFLVGDGVGAAKLVSNLLLTIIMGMVGGIVGGRLRTRRA
jgi:putative membrane protein (TIGR04086 family)